MLGLGGDAGKKAIHDLVSPKGGLNLKLEEACPSCPSQDVALGWKETHMLSKEPP